MEKRVQNAETQTFKGRQQTEKQEVTSLLLDRERAAAAAEELPVRTFERLHQSEARRSVLLFSLSAVFFIFSS